jgi:hypothetical protein
LVAEGKKAVMAFANPRIQALDPDPAPVHAVMASRSFLSNIIFQIAGFVPNPESYPRIGFKE